MTRITVSTRAKGWARVRALEIARGKVKDGHVYYVQRRGYWFRPAARGYTKHLVDAGQFTAAQARSYLDAEGVAVVDARSLKGDLVAAILVKIAELERLRIVLQLIP